MEILFILVIYLSVFAVILFVGSFLFTRFRKKKIKKKLDHIDDESKLLAIDELRKIVKKDPYNFYAREKLADLLIENKFYLPAIKEYLKLIDHSEDNAEIDEIKYFKKIGDAYLLIENFEDAKKYYLIIKSKEDLDFDANFKLAEIEMKTENYDKAESYYEIAAKIQPDNLDITKALGICYFYMIMYKEAASKLSNYIRIKEDDMEAVYYLAYSYYNNNRHSDAIKYLQMLRKSKEHASNAFYTLGIIHQSQKSYHQAIEDYDNALVSGEITDKEKLAEIYYNLGEGYFHTHELTKAVASWQKANDLVNGFRDVMDKLNAYSQLDSNAMLEMYLVGSVNQFTKICKSIVRHFITHYSTLKGTIKFIDTKTNREGSLEIMAEVTSKNFTEINYFVFIRSATTIGDMTVRNLYNTLKEQKADKGICITAGNYSESAKEFVESRMLHIIQKDELVEILNKISKKFISEEA